MRKLDIAEERFSKVEERCQNKKSRKNNRSTKSWEIENRHKIERTQGKCSHAQSQSPKRR